MLNIMNETTQNAKAPSSKAPIAETVQSAVLGNGCFWCLQASMRLVRGVIATVSGYAGGTTENPTYEEVCAGETGHAEVVKIDFDPTVVSYADLLDVFWATHNPTTPNQSGHDVGPQYRSIILYADDSQRAAAVAGRDAQADNWLDPIITEIKPLEIFYPAEDYHQDYYAKNPDAAYCVAVINPKLATLRAKLSSLLIDPDIK